MSCTLYRQHTCSDLVNYPEVLVLADDYQQIDQLDYIKCRRVELEVLNMLFATTFVSCVD